MKNAAQTRILAIALAIATLAACVLALINLERENSFEVPTDGVSWVDPNEYGWDFCLPDDEMVE